MGKSEEILEECRRSRSHKFRANKLNNAETIVNVDFMSELNISRKEIIMSECPEKIQFNIISGHSDSKEMFIYFGV